MSTTAVLGFVAMICGVGTDNIHTCFVHEAVYDTHDHCEVVVVDTVLQMLEDGARIELAECLPLIGAGEGQDT